MQNTKPATKKQLDFLLNLGADPKDLESLTVKEASIMIGQFLRQTKSDVKPDVKKDFTSQDLENLLAKYHASYKTGRNGFYLENEGSNSKSELLKDSRKFKSYILNVIKTEFKDIKVSKCSCSFQHYYNEYIDITITAPKSDIFKTFEDIRADYKSQYSTFDVLRYYFSGCDCSKWDDIYGATEKRIYDLYYTNNLLEFKNANTKEAEILQDSFKNKLEFIRQLLLSFSYDNSSYETDYFDSGLNFYVRFIASDANLDDKKAIENLLETCKDPEELLIKYPLSQDEDSELRKAVEKYQENAAIEEARYAAELEAQKAEYEKWALEQKENTEYISKHVKIIDLKETQYLKGSRFSTWNKPATLESAKEYVEKYPEAGRVGTIAEVKQIINFKDQKAFELFNNALLNDYEFLKDVNCGCGHVDYDTLDPVDYDTAYYMSLDEMEAHNIAWMRGCVIIALNGVNQYLVDTEGSNYCRYVGFLPDGSKTAPVKNDRWLSDEEKEHLKTAERYDFDIWDYGSGRSTNKVFWEELEKLGTVTKNENYWSFKKARA